MSWRWLLLVVFVFVGVWFSFITKSLVSFSERLHVGYVIFSLSCNLCAGLRKARRKGAQLVKEEAHGSDPHEWNVPFLPGVRPLISSKLFSINCKLRYRYLTIELQNTLMV